MLNFFKRNLIQIYNGGLSILIKKLIKLIKYLLLIVYYMPSFIFFGLPFIVFSKVLSFLIIIKRSKSQLLKELNIDENGSMGANLKEKDVSVILLLATQINNFYKLKKHYEDYLKELEKETCPNFATVAGVTIAAKLISHAGSLKRLVEMPASTIQILGAEKALFRHMRNKRRNLPPKYGMIHEHQLIQKSKSGVHGKVARALADKLSIAVKIDYFKGKFIGDKLKKGLVDKFKVQY